MLVLYPFCRGDKGSWTMLCNLHNFSEAQKINNSVWYLCLFVPLLTVSRTVFTGFVSFPCILCTFFFFFSGGPLANKKPHSFLEPSLIFWSLWSRVLHTFLLHCHTVVFGKTLLPTVNNFLKKVNYFFYWVVIKKS